MGSVTSTLVQTLPVYKRRSCSESRACLKGRQYACTHIGSRGFHSVIFPCEVIPKGHSIILPLRAVYLLCYQYWAPEWVPRFCLSLRTSLGTEPEKDKVDKESKLDKEFELRENDTCRDTPWETKLPLTSTSLVKAQGLKGRCLTQIPCLKKHITLV